jgi:hypothetical protein
VQQWIFVFSGAFAFLAEAMAVILEDSGALLQWSVM